MTLHSATEKANQPAVQSRVQVVVAADLPGPVLWAIERFNEAALAHGVSAAATDEFRPAAVLELCHEPEMARDSFEFQPTNGRLVLRGDQRGLTYGVLELADRVACGADPIAVIARCTREASKPAANLRSVVRYFTNRNLDLPWFLDETFWPEYLTELATHRFDRFSLAFGLGQDFGHDHGVTDNYLSYVYPFLLDVPGFNVTARGVDAKERARNLAALRYVAAETVRRGLRFNLSLWAQNYTFPMSPELNYPIEGLDNAIWPAYSGRALRLLLETIPEISGLTLRMHYEGGVPDNDRHRYWSAVLDEIKQCGRTVEIDIHSKGADAPTVALFQASGMPLTVSTKFAGEHLTLPYHAASIRPQERQPANVGGDMAVTRGARIFTRYSYGDFMRRDRGYKIATRVWNGTQRFMLWADPVFARSIGREAAFDGADGLEVFDPLSLRGRWDTAGDATRAGYSDPSLEPERDWHKYRLFYRAWGRGLYGDGVEQSWQRYLTYAYGDDGPALGEAIATASRVLPLAMSVHAPGAGNRDYWPELYADVPYLDEPGTASERRRMGTISPLDPELFYGIAEYVEAEAANKIDSRYRPTEIAEWFDALANNVDASLASVGKLSGSPARRLAADARLEAGLARFFAAKYRAALFYERYCRAAVPADIHAAARYATAALEHWRAISELGDATYVADIGFGRPERLGGNWSSRLIRVRKHAEVLVHQAQKVFNVGAPAEPFLKTRQLSDRPDYQHVPVEAYRVGSPLDLAVAVPGASEVTLHVRPVNHAELFQTLPMAANGDTFTARISAELTSGKFDLIYFFTAWRDGVPWLLPGLGPDLSARPYLLARGG